MSTPTRLVVVVALLVGQTALAPVALAGAGDALDERTDTAASADAAGTLPADVVETLDGVVPAVDAVDDVTVGVLTVLVPPASHRWAGEFDPFDNDVRETVFAAVEATPGVHLAGVAELTDVAPSTVRYHARVLEAEDLVRTETRRGKRRLYPGDADPSPVTAALSDDATARLVRAVAEREPVRVSDLADAVDRAPSTVSYHLSRLEADDVVVRERDGEAVRVSLTTSARQTLDDGVA
ncbi:winged helix-turn-helix transcriptional regulator [Halorarius halobius]|uniref:winged helix-turn-helix transcriptional regulator n=1 Tax=Halorarius halobius TaxID=2962671 RepID=UPI0020CBBF0D|nr:helix-turn-helix domain-containing protein [Halorarius halobius]